MKYTIRCIKFKGIYFIKATGNIRFCDGDIKKWKGYPVMIGLCASKIDLGEPSNGKRWTSGSIWTGNYGYDLTV